MSGKNAADAAEIAAIAEVPATALTATGKGRSTADWKNK